MRVEDRQDIMTWVKVVRESIQDVKRLIKQLVRIHTFIPYEWFEAFQRCLWWEKHIQRNLTQVNKIHAPMDKMEEIYEGMVCELQRANQMFQMEVVEYYEILQETSPKE